MNGIWQIAEGKKIKLAPFYQPYMCVYVYLPGIEDIFNKSALYSSAFPLSADTSFRYLFIYLFIFSDSGFIGKPTPQKKNNFSQLNLSTICVRL